MVVIRPAERSDLPELVRIYNHYVVRTPITFDTAEFRVEERLPWFEKFSHAGPHRLLVAELDARPVGYASSGEFRAKPAYVRSVETTIYLEPDATGQGIGPTLYSALLQALEAEKDVHRALAGITLPNAPSLALHERLGFEPVGTFREVGFKFGTYWDVRWYERSCRLR